MNHLSTSLKKEPTGAHERDFTDEEKEKIIKFLKYDRHVHAKIKHKMWMAVEEADYFEKAGTVAAVFLSGITFYMPKVRNLNIMLRLGCTAVPGYLMHNWGVGAKEQILWQRAFIGYQKHIVQNGAHPKIFI